MKINDLYKLSDGENIQVKEYPLQNGLKGLYKDKKIIIRRGMTGVEVKCILAEELGHHFCTYGDIIDQSDIQNRKQERIARKWAYKKLLPIEMIKEAVDQGAESLYEMADYMEVTEDFLKEALEYYFTTNHLTEEKSNGTES